MVRVRPARMIEPLRIAQSFAQLGVPMQQVASATMELKERGRVFAALIIFGGQNAIKHAIVEMVEHVVMSMSFIVLAIHE